MPALRALCPTRPLIWEIYHKDFQFFRYDFENSANRMPAEEVDLEGVHLKLRRKAPE